MFYFEQVGRINSMENETYKDYALTGEVSFFSKKSSVFVNTRSIIIFSFQKQQALRKRAFKNDFLPYFCSKMEVC